MTVAVIGGGITGLTAAYRLVSRGIPVVLYESDLRLGGKISTEDFEGRPVEAGPDAFLARVPWATDLCRELGLGDQLVSPSGDSAYVYSRGKLRRIPKGLVLGVPSNVMDVARSGMLPPLGLARAGLEPLMARLAYRGEPDNVGGLLRHHFGGAVVERLVDPLVGGIYAGSCDTMSLDAGVPQLAGMPPGHSMIFELRRRAAAAPANPGAPIFHTVAGGLSTLVGALAAHLPAGSIRLGTRVEELIHEKDSVLVRGTAPSGSFEERVDKVVVCAPAFAAASMLRRCDAAAAILGSIAYASVVLVTMSFDDQKVGRNLDATGFLVPRPERRFLTACSWASTKWPSWSTPGRVLMRASAGAIDQPGVCELDDQTILERTTSDLERLMGLRVSADRVRVNRWPSAFPQYQPGHLGRISDLDAVLLRETPNIVVTGAALRGVGIPACIRQGTEAAARCGGGDR